MVRVRKISERARILLAGVLGPKQSDLPLFGRAHRAIGSAEEPYEIVIALPLFAPERRGAIRLHLGGRAQSERTHLAQPRSQRRRHCRWRRNPRSSSCAWIVGNGGF